MAVPASRLPIHFAQKGLEARVGAQGMGMGADQD
jgi:hypothetical protein